MVSRRKRKKKKQRGAAPVVTPGTDAVSSTNPNPTGSDARPPTSNPNPVTQNDQTSDTDSDKDNPPGSDARPSTSNQASDTESDNDSEKSLPQCNAEPLKEYIIVDRDRCRLNGNRPCKFLNSLLKLFWKQYEPMDSNNKSQLQSDFLYLLSEVTTYAIVKQDNLTADAFITIDMNHRFCSRRKKKRLPRMPPNVNLEKDMVCSICWKEIGPDIESLIAHEIECEKKFYNVNKAAIIYYHSSPNKNLEILMQRILSDLKGLNRNHDMKNFLIFKSVKTSQVNRLDRLDEYEKKFEFSGAFKLIDELLLDHHNFRVNDVFGKRSFLNLEKTFPSEGIGAPPNLKIVLHSFEHCRSLKLVFDLEKQRMVRVISTKLMGDFIITKSQAMLEWFDALDDKYRNDLLELGEKVLHKSHKKRTDAWRIDMDRAQASSNNCCAWIATSKLVERLDVNVGMKMLSDMKDNQQRFQSLMVTSAKKNEESLADILVSYGYEIQKLKGVKRNRFGEFDFEHVLSQNTNDLLLCLLKKASGAVDHVIGIDLLNQVIVDGDEDFELNLSLENIIKCAGEDVQGISNAWKIVKKRGKKRMIH